MSTELSDWVPKIIQKYVYTAEEKDWADDEALAPLREHVAAREARLLVRSRSLRAGLEGSPFAHTD